MKRWISAAGVTLAVLLLAFFASGAVHTEARAAAVQEAGGEVAAVSIVRRHKAKPITPAHTAAEKPKPKTPPKESAPTIPTAEEKPAEPEEAEADFAENAVDDTESAADTTEIAATNGAESTGMAADSYSAGEDAERSYKSYALSRIAGKKKYPVGARSKGQQGKVKLRIVIEPDGTLSEAGFVRESEFALLNEASLAAVRKSAPFKKMPRGMRRQEYVFVIDYSLE